MSITSRNGRSSSSSRCAHAASSASANTGNSVYSSRLMPARCAPCPVNRNAIRPSPVTPRTTVGAEPPFATVSRAVSSSARSVPNTTARWSMEDRVVASE